MSASTQSLVAVSICDVVTVPLAVTTLPFHDAWTLLLPVVPDVSTTVHVPSAVVEQLLACSVPTPDFVKSICSPAGASTNPLPSPLSNCRWAVNVWGSPTRFTADPGVRSSFTSTHCFLASSELAVDAALPSAVATVPSKVAFTLDSPVLPETRST